MSALAPERPTPLSPRLTAALHTTRPPLHPPYTVAELVDALCGIGAALDSVADVRYAGRIGHQISLRRVPGAWLVRYTPAWWRSTEVRIAAPTTPVTLPPAVVQRALQLALRLLEQARTDHTTAQSGDPADLR